MHILYEFFGVFEIHLYSQIFESLKRSVTVSQGCIHNRIQVDTNEISMRELNICV